MVLHLGHVHLKARSKLSGKSFLGDCHFSINWSGLESLAGGKGSLISTALLRCSLVLGLSFRRIERRREVKCHAGNYATNQKKGTWKSELTVLSIGSFLSNKAVLPFLQYT